jgi:DNA repair photolyase
MKEFKSFYKDVNTGNEGSLCNYTTRLDTYGCGCSHDCSYCYAKSLLNFRGLWNPTDPSVADIEKIRKKLKKIQGTGKVIRLGGMTDCFQPFEKTHRVTYETLKILKEYRIEYLIVTKSDLVASDEYIEVLDKDLAHIQVSVTTTDDEKSLTYEKAVVPSRRIAAIEKLQSLGFDVQLRLSPFIPEFIDIDVINNVKCDKILVEFLRVNTWVKKWFDIDFSDYTLHSHGYNHLPLEKKIEYLNKIKFKEISVCEDVPEHHKYWGDNVNVNPNDCCNLKR